MLSAISIDVDPIRFYQAIHGLKPHDVAYDPIYEIALPRFFALLAQAKIPATIFLVGVDADRAHLKDGLNETRSELASHSHQHDYRLSRSSKDAILHDLRSADRALSRISGRAVRGFRAPGYNTSSALLEAVSELGYTYDSSLLPAPAYFGARAAAVAWYALRRRPSASMAGDLRAFWGPTRPYRMAPKAPWKPVPDGPLVELPMAVSPLARIPLIGTSWTTMPASLGDALLGHTLRRGAPFVFEMHAIDLLDATDPGVPEAVAASQPDLKVPASSKLKRFETLFRTLRAHSETKTMGDLADRLFRM